MRRPDLCRPHDPPYRLPLLLFPLTWLTATLHATTIRTRAQDECQPLNRRMKVIYGHSCLTIEDVNGVHFLSSALCQHCPRLSQPSPTCDSKIHLASGG